MLYFGDFCVGISLVVSRWRR